MGVWNRRGDERIGEATRTLTSDSNFFLGRLAKAG